MANPRGGMEPGETEHETLQRELYEEIGRRDLLIGPEIWRRVHGFKSKARCWSNMSGIT